MSRGPASLGRLFLMGSFVGLTVSGCAWNAAGSTGCIVDRAPVALDRGLGESSGLAPAGESGSPFVWTHNDSGSEPVLYRVGFDGFIHDSVRLALGSVEPRDLEALEKGSCTEGRCLYLADVGDNEEDRHDPVIYRFPEPAPSAETVTATPLPIRFPGGPTDVEAMFVLPGERIHLVSKGRSGPVRVYRYPLPLRPRERVTLEEVQTLTEHPPGLPDLVTGAGAHPGGGLVVVRTYRAIQFYRVDEGRLVALPGGRVALRSLREAQGEAVAVLPDGRLVLSSEAGPLGRRGSLAILRCPSLSRG